MAVNYRHPSTAAHQEHIAVQRLFHKEKERDKDKHMHNIMSRGNKNNSSGQRLEEGGMNCNVTTYRPTAKHINHSAMMAIVHECM
jgi:hypothetical protein